MKTTRPAEISGRTVYVRYLGDKACWTVDDGRFYVGDREELSDAERTVCDNGGGDMPLSWPISMIAR